MNLHSAILNEPGMAALAAGLARLLRPGDCLALSGDLGAGKTTFARAAIQVLAGHENVPSPTFTLVQQYDTAHGPLWHFDLYRLKLPEEVYELGFEDALSDIVLIEWPERAKDLLPRGHLRLNFASAADENMRQLTLEGDEAWGKRLTPLFRKTE
jgi:tRNA threonylcarbamoyl adenosine modification protein YjeE